jgi:hypothetical protein
LNIFYVEFRVNQRYLREENSCPQIPQITANFLLLNISSNFV